MLAYLQQHRPQQTLRQNRRPTKTRRIEHRKLPRQIAQRRVRNLPDRPQRMIPPNTRVQIYVAE